MMSQAANCNHLEYLNYISLMNLDEYIWIQLTSSDDALLFTLMTELLVAMND